MTTGTIYACAECGDRPSQVDGKRIYPARPELHYRKYWLCPCGAYCGSHASTGQPLGKPAGPETRRARHAAHEAFDPFWLKPGDKRWHRRQAYRWLAGVLDLCEEDCHIGMMNEAECERVELACEYGLLVDAIVESRERQAAREAEAAV